MQKSVELVPSPARQSSQGAVERLRQVEAPDDSTQPTEEGIRPYEKQAHDAESVDQDDDDALSGVPQINLYGAWGFPDPFDPTDSAVDAADEASEGDIDDHDDEVLNSGNAGSDATSEPVDEDSASQLSQRELQRLAALTRAGDGKTADKAVAMETGQDRQPQQAPDFLRAGSLPRARDGAGPQRVLGRPGGRWLSGTCFTITQTVVYAIDMGAGQVHDIKCSWEEVQGGNSNEQEAFELYTHLAGLQDAEETEDSDVE